jgi:small subunit ribosomal protein S20
MPHSANAKKRLRQSLERRERNRAVKRSLKTYIRKLVDAVKEGNLEAAGEAMRVASQKLDRAAVHKIIHKNAAARCKSRMAAKVKALKFGKTEAPAK